MHQSKPSTRTALLVLAAGLLMTYTQGARAQKKEPAAERRITGARVAREENQMTGSVYATIDGTERKIAEVGVEVLVIEGGRRMVYSGLDGSGGFENEGQSLQQTSHVGELSRSGCRSCRSAAPKRGARRPRELPRADRRDR